jgi:hypothetical protein
MEVASHYTGRPRQSTNGSDAHPLLDEIERERNTKKIVDDLIGVLAYVSDGRYRRRRDEGVIEAVKRTISHLPYSAVQGQEG